jgi:hypothetical protein
MSPNASMTKPLRSPVVGYNHNLRYRGRLFHVQSEDSGPVNPHVFTHLFFEGTILSSKKLQYDAEAHEDAVKGQMQQLHKAMIKELMHGAHDARVVAFFAARGQEAFSEPPRAAAAIVTAAPATATAGPEAAPAPEGGPLPAPVPPLAPPVIQVTGVVAGNLDSGPARRPAQATPAQVKATPRPIIMVKPMKRPPMVFSSSADGVVVQRNVVIGASAPGTGEIAAVAESRAQKIRPAAVVGEPSAVSPPQAAGAMATGAAAGAAPGGAARGRGAMADKAFSDLVSDKSLDEVILEYLSDDSEPERR